MVSRLGDDLPRSSNPQQPPTVWTVAELLRWTEAHFKRLGFPTPRLDAELLLAHVMGFSRLELYTDYGKVAEVAERAAFRSLVERRCRSEPVAYILGYREFYSLRFEVNSAVLVPRPETEVLVSQALAALATDAVQRTVRILEIGTGCGNIAIALAANLSKAFVTAVEISEGALEVARRNAARHRVEDRIEFLLGDLFEPVRQAHAGGVPSDPEMFDAVVSNPPYVSLSEYDELMPDVRQYEPPEALLDRRSGNGLGFFQALASDAVDLVHEGGVIALEVGASQAESVQDLLRHQGWEEIRAVSDYAGIPRVVTARRPEKRMTNSV